jgi:hypothetical protein
VQAEKFRRRAAICMRFAERVSNPTIALRLKIMAGEYLMKAEEEESLTAGTPVAGDNPSAPGLNLPAAALQEPKE